jgi:hypothetical protein
LPTLETVRLHEYGIGRNKNEPLSIWYGQPILQLPDEPPFIPKPGPYATGLQILQGILEHRDFRESDCKPAIIVLPELAVPYTDIATARTLISNAPRGTLVVFGAGQMTEKEALSLEARPELWDGEAAGRFANCAVIGMGGFDRLFLQPKLLKSALEKDWHWPGRIVRCFFGEYVRFSIFICSDLLNRPGDSSYMAWLHDQLEREQNRLTFAVWLQHNPKPRSDQFSNAIDAVGKMDRTTIIVAGSRMVTGGRRFENFAVSGALASRVLFPSEFDKFTHRFHYAEHSGLEVSRAVLLRYDADAYRVRTVLADALDVADKVEKGELFDSSQPYIFSNGALGTSSENSHIRDLLEPARLIVRAALPDLAIATDSVSLKLTEMGTSRFLSFLDLGIVPQTPDGEKPHPAGVKHEGGDLRCRCWKHRNCIDLLTEPDGRTPLVAIIQTLAVLEAGGCGPKPRYEHKLRTNVDLTFGDSQISAVMVYPFSFAFEALQLKLFGERPPVLKRQFILVADPLQSRPPVDSINVAEAPAVGAIDPVKAGAPTIAPVNASELRRAGLAGELTTYLRRLFADES